MADTMKGTWWEQVCSVADQLEPLEGLRLMQTACIMGSELVHAVLEAPEVFRLNGPGSIRRTDHPITIDDPLIGGAVVMTKTSPPLEYLDEMPSIWEIKELNANNDFEHLESLHGGYLPEYEYEEADLSDPEDFAFVNAEIKRYGELFCSVAVAAGIDLPEVRPLALR